MYAQGAKIMKQSYSYFPTHIVANERFIKRHSAPPNNVQILKRGHLFSDIPANDTISKGTHVWNLSYIQIIYNTSSSSSSSYPF